MTKTWESLCHCHEKIQGGICTASSGCVLCWVWCAGESSRSPEGWQYSEPVMQSPVFHTAAKKSQSETVDILYFFLLNQNKTYCFFGCVAIRHNVQNPTNDELPKEMGKCFWIQQWHMWLELGKETAETQLTVDGLTTETACERETDKESCYNTHQHSQQESGWDDGPHVVTRVCCDRDSDDEER